MREEKIEKADKVKKEIIREYDKNPKEWRVLMGPDSENYLSSLFLHNNKF